MTRSPHSFRDQVPALLLVLAVTITVTIAFHRLNESLTRMQSVLDRQVCYADLQTEENIALARLVIALHNDDDDQAAVAVEDLSRAADDLEALESICDVESRDLEALPDVSASPSSTP